MRRVQLSKKDLKEFNEKIFNDYGKADFIDKKSVLYTLEDEKSSVKILFIDSRPCFFYLGDKIFPTLKSLLANNFLKIIAIDMPAVKFIANGADLMRPGIKEFDKSIKKDDVVAIVDEINKKPIALGTALMSAEEMSKTNSGKTVKNLHHVGDEIWTFSG